MLISTASGIADLARSLKGRDLIAIDTEFVRESTFYPIVEIVQVATDEETWIVDAQAFKKKFRPGSAGGFDPGIKPLLEIFEDPSILKILHAAQGDQECLYTSFGTLAHPTLDTAVAASLCGYGEGIGLSKLLKAVEGIDLPKGHARTNWSVRPLPEQLLEYAAADVKHLNSAARKLLTKLDQSGRRAWALELSSKWEHKELYEVSPMELARKLAKSGRLDKKGFAALVALVTWREERVRELNLPRRWVADDSVLMDLARVRPKDLEHLKAFRGLNKGEVQKSGQKILTAVQSEPLPDEAAPFKKSFEVPSGGEAQAMDLLQCYVGILADRHQVSAKNLLLSAQLLPLLRAKAQTPEELVAQGLIAEPACKLIGRELLDFLHGKIRLSLRSDRPASVDIQRQPE